VLDACGAPREDVYHYLFTCPNYTEIRLTMMNNLNWVQTIDLNLLTCGSDVLTYEERMRGWRVDTYQIIILQGISLKI
jgi:hypothetical protein